MIKYLYTILTTKNPHLYYEKLLVEIIIILIVFFIYKTASKSKKIENFTQEKSFLLKKNENIYDKFYVEIYDGITDRTKTCQRELYKIVKMTEADTRNSVILDVGCGSGCVLNELTRAGFNAVGIEKSIEMIKYSESLYKDINIIEADVLDPIIFDNNVFSHILCTNFTIYELKNKKQFFENCYFWLNLNGYLIIHLVDREKFSAKTFKDSIMDIHALYRSMQKPGDIKKTSAEFIDFVYDAVYEVDSKTNTVIFKEKFVDKETNHIRENENTLYMEPIEEILKIASNSGFIIKGKSNMKNCNGDENQYLYVFEKTV